MSTKSLDTRSIRPGTSAMSTTMAMRTTTMHPMLKGCGPDSSRFCKTYQSVELREPHKEGDIIRTVDKNTVEYEGSEATLIRQGSGQDRRAFDLDNVFDRFKSVRQASYFKAPVQSYYWYQMRYSYLISKQLLEGKYKPQPVDEFDLVERGKPRHIKANKVNDRVVNNVLERDILRPLTEPRLIYDNGASRKNFGTDHSRRRLEKHLHDAVINFGMSACILLSDIKNFFGSIDINLLLTQYRALITDDLYFETLERQIRAHNEGDVGLGLGSVISQNAGLYYFHRVDNYIKIVLGRKYYGRYMDDFYIICRDKEEAKELKKLISGYVLKETSLNLNVNKTQIVPLTREFTYLKFRYKVTPTGKVKKRQCKDTFIRERRKLKRFKNTDMSDEDIILQYKSWRGALAPNPFNEPRLLKTDKVFEAQYPHLVKYVDFS